MTRHLRVVAPPIDIGTAGPPSPARRATLAALTAGPARIGPLSNPDRLNPSSVRSLIDDGLAVEQIPPAGEGGRWATLTPLGREYAARWGIPAP